MPSGGIFDPLGIVYSQALIFLYVHWADYV